MGFVPQRQIKQVKIQICERKNRPVHGTYFASSFCCHLSQKKICSDITCQAQRLLKEKYNKPLKEATPDLFGTEFLKAVQKDARSVDLSTIRYLQMQSKQKFTPFRGGSTVRSRHSSNTVEHTKAAQTSTRGSKGKSSTKNEKNTHLQHRAKASTKDTCPPSNLGPNKPNNNIPTNGGETETFPPTMGETNKRPADFRLGQGLQNSTITVPSAKCHPKTTGNERGTKN